MNKSLICMVWTGLLLICPGLTQASTTPYTSLPQFITDAGLLTLVNFDVDSNGDPISAPSPGILAADNFAGYGITFSSGVVFGEPNLPFIGVSPPNTISNSGINTPTTALVDGTFASGVEAVGITNVGAGAVLRVFDASDSLLGEIFSDTDTRTLDFLGLISTTPISRMEFDFVSGLGFEGDDLLFTRIQGMPAVPLPAALWLFGSALIGFIGIRRRKIAT